MSTLSATRRRMNSLPMLTNPIWLASPVAPLVAARLENRELEIGELETWFRHHRSRRRSLLVEGVGGWLTPVTAKLRAADLAALFKLPVLLVVANRLGCLNHTLLTIESIRAHDQECHATDPQLTTWCLPTSPRRQTGGRLEEICDVPILFEIARDQQSIELAVA